MKEHMDKSCQWGTQSPTADLLVVLPGQRVGRFDRSLLKWCGAVCVVDTELVLGAGSEQAQQQLSGGVRRKDRYYYRTRRESGNAAEASGTSLVVSEATFSPRVLEGNLAGLQAEQVQERR
ncbi:hypothetical protein HPB47_022276 [Ixodes persulcatus]|uniref:Uncharacterized protein n=1 Tax=Ixodes persulcatus TaxID=34615 RepID=A0AC60QAW9_IXOPE|nr:hypothetical protein HPB47_022276 [Ixodes persulcatus]